MLDTELPPVLFSDDWARTRGSDPLTSHTAADQSQRGLSALRLAVLSLIRANGDVIGSEINDIYSLAVSRGTVPRAAWDSPRKRAGELFAKHYLDQVGTRAGETGAQERVFRINDRGLAALEA